MIGLRELPTRNPQSAGVLVGIETRPVRAENILFVEPNSRMKDTYQDLLPKEFKLRDITEYSLTFIDSAPEAIRLLNIGAHANDITRVIIDWNTTWEKYRETDGTIIDDKSARNKIWELFEVINDIHFFRGRIIPVTVLISDVSRFPSYLAEESKYIPPKIKVLKKP